MHGSGRLHQLQASRIEAQGNERAGDAAHSFARGQHARLPNISSIDWQASITHRDTQQFCVYAVFQLSLSQCLPSVF